MHFSTCKFGIHGNKRTHLAILHPLTYIETIVSHFLSNGHEIFTKASLIILQKRGVSIFGYQLKMLNCMEVKLSVFVEACNPRVLSP